MIPPIKHSTVHETGIIDHKLQMWQKLIQKFPMKQNARMVLWYI